MTAAKKAKEPAKEDNHDLAESLKRTIETNELASDVFWVFHALSEIKDDADLPRVQAIAPTTGAKSLLAFAHAYRLHFFKEILPKAFAHKMKDGVMNDDGRKRLEIFGPIYDQIHQEYTAKRKCPMCGRGLTHHTVLFRRPQKAH